MTELQTNPVTRRNLKTHFQAFVDPSYPGDNFWSVFGYTPVPERGRDVSMTGELAVVHGQGATLTGKPLSGVYETYWSHYAHGGLTLAIIAQGSKALGAVSAGSLDLKYTLAFAVTTGEGTQDSNEAFHKETSRSYRTVSGVDAIVCPLGADIYHVSIDVLVDAQHEPCGYVFNGEDEFVFEERLLPGETSRLTTRKILDKLALASHDRTLEVISSDGTRIGTLTSFDPAATWKGTVGGHRSITVGEVLDEGNEAVPDATSPASQLGMLISSGPYGEGAEWVREVELVGDRVLLHLLAAAPLPDSAY